MASPNSPLDLARAPLLLPGTFGIISPDVPREEKGCSIVGVFWGTFTSRDPQRNQEHLRELMAWYQEGKIRPHISATYPLERVADALNDMLTRRITGKAVLLVGE